MSQKKESNPSDKWRELEEQESENFAENIEESPEKTVDDAHLLEDEGENKTLRDKMMLLEKQIDAYRDQVVRGQAEIENMHRRMEQEVSKARKFGVERIISELIPVADSLVRALEISAKDNSEAKQLHAGMELTLTMLHKILEKNGVLSIDPQIGDAFDPTLHEAMSMRPDPDAKHNTILQVLQKGYSLHGRVIRAAMVIVSQ